MTLQNLFTQYFELIEPLQSLQTVRTKKGFTKKHILPVFGDKKIQDIDYLMLQTFVNNLLMIELKPKTVKNILEACID